MSTSTKRLPEPLRDAGGTELEQRLLRAGSREEPSRALTERMAKAIGVAPPAIGAGSGGSGSGTLAPEAATGSSALVPWISGVVVAVAVGGALVVAWPRATPAPSRPFSSSAPEVKAPPPAPVAPDVAAVPEVERAPAPPARAASTTAGRAAPGRAAAPVADLRNQIALLDAARSALATGANERALEVLQRYLSKYPAGSFRPEANALKVEALVGLGRTGEARALADRFGKEQPGSPLADRVKGLTGQK